MEEQPGLKMTEQVTVLAKKWKNLTSEQKKSYEILAENDIRRYAKEI